MENVRLIKHDAVPKCGSFEGPVSGWSAVDVFLLG